jgi:hypothetical protein
MIGVSAVPVIAGMQRINRSILKENYMLTQLFEFVGLM